MTEMAMTFDSEESDIIIALISAVGDGVLTEATPTIRLNGAPQWEWLIPACTDQMWPARIPHIAVLRGYQLPPSTVNTCQNDRWCAGNFVKGTFQVSVDVFCLFSNSKFSKRSRTIGCRDLATQATPLMLKDGRLRTDFEPSSSMDGALERAVRDINIAVRGDNTSMPHRQALVRDFEEKP
ncbi:unnamed protein product [Heligmosomoides polygyrus]|uniref:Bacteriophage protein n=1 Tax=Heligmosomoides polygyrus TaxID=6339 RepID=A0A183FGK7_HELPZ|nr:unnamed protein product [Heligmosomoides polygyrus]